jgi:hypothetical protein
MLKKLYFPLTLVALIALALFIGACNEDSLSSSDPEETMELTGAPTGPHYNLNIIGVPKNKTASMTGNNGRRIFVKLEGNTKIYLSEGDFQVLDANGTDGDGAKFQLPNPDPDSTGTTWYSVFGRALGQPGGSATMTTCGTDTGTGDEYCSTFQAVFIRDKGSTFRNVSKYLLYIYADTDGDGDPDKRYSLFDDELENYLWSYDNDGLKLLQLRFYEVSTTVPGL